MSYDLIFWKEVTPINEPPDRVCEMISNDEAIEGIAELPIDQIKMRFLEVFPDIDDNGAEMYWEGEESGFTLTWPPNPTNAIIAQCGYGLLESPQIMNQIIDIAHEFGCGLYDPQVGKRFEQS